jgi:hypothetical protein
MRSVRYLSTSWTEVGLLNPSSTLKTEAVRSVNFRNYLADYFPSHPRKWQSQYRRENYIPQIYIRFSLEWRNVSNFREVILCLEEDKNTYGALFSLLRINVKWKIWWRIKTHNHATFTLFRDVYPTTTWNIYSSLLNVSNTKFLKFTKLLAWHSDLHFSNGVLLKTLPGGNRRLNM